ncbi:MAG: hypothetical protein AUI08_05210 [Gemmatimonadetes bacterium 13_2_20CM_2_65_7]|nr:MAG: hypothetical protein AUI08_05210 [Gemmatimonadetes bacterium 13_2_20CM_2_65_7]
MSQSVKAMIVVAALVVVGVAANQFSRAQARAVGSTCRYGSSDRQRICYSQLLSDHLTHQGVADAVATLDAIAAADPDVAERAHEYAHGLGIEAYSTSPDIAATFSACGDGFSSGCRHGVIQAYFESREQVTQPEVEALCQPFRSASASRWVLFQCVHGMGHGLTMFRGHDLPQALTDCDLLSDGWDRESCYGGAFMENVINVTSPHHPATELAAHGHHHMAMSSFKAIDPADPLYPCSIVAERYLHACYQMQTSVMLYENHGDIAAAAKSCERAPAAQRPVCFQSLGRDITSYTARDPQKTADLCAQARDAYRPSCYFGAVKALVDWTATTNAAFTFCGIVLREPGAPTCYRALGEEIATLLAAAPEKEEQCTRAQTPEAVEACRLGAGLAVAR